MSVFVASVVFGLLAAAGAVALCWFAVSRTRREPRRLSNGVLIGVAIVVLLNTAAAIGIPGTGAVIGLLGLLLVLAPLFVLLLTVFLILNGLQMLRRESRSLGNMLSLLLGLVLLALSVAPLLLIIQRGNLVLAAVIVGLEIVAGYFGFVLINFLIYSAFYRWLVRNWKARWLVVLGSGLGQGGRVTPLLAARIRTGLVEATRREVEILVMSGGKGDDEIRPEGEAMTAYAIEQGADPSQIIAETRSRNTEQNLQFSTALLGDRLGSDKLLSDRRAALPGRDAEHEGSGPAALIPSPRPADDQPQDQPQDQPEAQSSRLGPGLIVTSNYHVMRAAILARRLGIDAQAAGAPTAGYYWPSAVIREFVAVLVEHRWWHLSAAILLAVPVPLLLLTLG